MKYVIYIPGSTTICTTVTNGNADYTDQTADEYVASHPGAVEMPLEMAMIQIGEAQDKEMIGPWEEITEDQWQEMLEVLPPDRWRHHAGIEFFQMCETLSGNITSTFARVTIDGQRRHFTADRRTSARYADLEMEIREVIA